jgi:hypothetical protein
VLPGAATESVFPRVLHRPDSATSKSAIIAPIARSALSAKGQGKTDADRAAAAQRRPRLAAVDTARVRHDKHAPRNSRLHGQ